MATLLPDLLSLLYTLIGLSVLWRLFKNRRAFWDDEVTPADRSLANRLAFFVLIPLTVPLHEAGHALATRQMGGQVVEFQWRIFWGYVTPKGHFTAYQDWWISLSGNLVSILLGLLPILLIPRVRKRIVGELLYAFARNELFFALVWYPILTFLGFGGDWVTIYDFTIAPHPHITLALHLALIAGLWWLDRSAVAARWRIRRYPGALDALQQLEAEARAEPQDVHPQVKLAYLYHRLGERSLSRRHEKQAERIAPEDDRLKAAQALMAYDQKQYHKAQQAAEAALEGGLSQKGQLAMHRVLALALMQAGRRPEALAHFDAALSLSPDDSDLYYWRAVVKRTLRRDDEACRDLEQAMRLARDVPSRQRAQRELESIRSRGAKPC